MTYGSLCAEFYDLEKPIGNDYPDLAFIRSVLDGAEANARVLEAAVGTGRLLVPLREAGVVIDGIDPSAAMLARCRANLASRGLDAQLWQSTIEEFQPAHRYQLALLTFGTVALFDPHDALPTVLRKLRGFLGPRGRLLLDVYRPPSDDEPIDEARSERIVARRDGSRIRISVKRTRADGSNKTTLALSYAEFDSNGSELRTERQSLVLWDTVVERITEALRKAGFDEIALTANFGLPGSGRDADEPVAILATAPA